MLNRRSFSDVLPESPKSARKKEEARQAEFVRIGQVKIYIQIPSLHKVWSINKWKMTTREIFKMGKQIKSLYSKMQKLKLRFKVCNKNRLKKTVQPKIRKLGQIVGNRARRPKPKHNWCEQITWFFQTLAQDKNTNYGWSWGHLKTPHSLFFYCIKPGLQGAKLGYPSVWWPFQGWCNRSYTQTEWCNHSLDTHSLSVSEEVSLMLRYSTPRPQKYKNSWLKLTRRYRFG